MDSTRFIRFVSIAVLGALVFLVASIILERIVWKRCCLAVSRLGGQVFWSEGLPDAVNSQHRVFRYPSYVIIGSWLKGSEYFRSSHVRILASLRTLEHITISELDVEAQDLEFVLNSCRLVRKVDLIELNRVEKKEEYLKQRFPDVIFSFETAARE